MPLSGQTAAAKFTRSMKYWASSSISLSSRRPDSISSRRILAASSGEILAVSLSEINKSLNITFVLPTTRLLRESSAVTVDSEKSSANISFKSSVETGVIKESIIDTPPATFRSWTSKETNISEAYWRQSRAISARRPPDILQASVPLFSRTARWSEKAPRIHFSRAPLLAFSGFGFRRARARRSKSAAIENALRAFAACMP